MEYVALRCPVEQSPMRVRWQWITQPTKKAVRSVIEEETIIGVAIRKPKQHLPRIHAHSAQVPADAIRGIQCDGHSRSSTLIHGRLCSIRPRMPQTLKREASHCRRPIDEGLTRRSLRDELPHFFHVTGCS